MQLVSKGNMKQRLLRNGLPILIIAALTCYGCSAFDLPQETGVLLFQDNFDLPSSGWDRYHDDRYSSDYYSGSYRIEVNQPNYEAWAVPGLEFSDVLIDVTAKKISGPDNNVFGIICRYNKPNDFFFFLISSDGYAGIGIYQKGKQTLLSGGNMLPADPINTGSVSNKIHVECIGDALSLSVNDVILYEVQSTALQSGDVGIIAGTYELADVQVEYDDFVVRNP